jgi:hypothetical protein
MVCVVSVTLLPIDYAPLRDVEKGCAQSQRIQ